MVVLPATKWEVAHTTPSTVLLGLNSISPMNLDYFRDKARVSTDGQSINVDFTHWARRSKSFSFDVGKVRAIEAVQIEPATMLLTFVLEDDKRWAITDEMVGWNSVLAFVQSHFAGFDHDAYERAKGGINSVFPCWKKQGDSGRVI